MIGLAVLTPQPISTPISPYTCNDSIKRAPDTFLSGPISLDEGPQLSYVGHSDWLTGRVGGVTCHAEAAEADGRQDIYWFKVFPEAPLTSTTTRVNHREAENCDRKRSGYVKLKVSFIIHIVTMVTAQFL